MAVQIAGDFMDCSLAHFARGCEVYLAEEQAKPAPDTHLIELLCNGVRLTREQARSDAARNELVQWLIDARMEIQRLRHQVATSCPTCGAAASA